MKLKNLLLLIFGFFFCLYSSVEFEESINFPEQGGVGDLKHGLEHLDLSHVPRFKGEIGEQNLQQFYDKKLEKLEGALKEIAEPRTLSKEPDKEQEIENQLHAIYQDKALENKEVSLQAKEINIKELLNAIGKAIGINLMVDPRVKGVLGSLNLKKCGAGQALELICRQATPEAALVKSGNVWHVTTREAARNMLTQTLKQHNQEKEFKSFPVNHAPVDKAFKEKVENGWKNLSQQESDTYIHVDEDQKKIFAKGTTQALQRFQKYLQEVDQPILQVRLDVIVVLAKKEFFFDFGIDWSGIYNREKTVQEGCKGFDFYGLGGTLLDFPDPADQNASTVSSPSPVVPNPPNRSNPNLFVDPFNWAINLFNSGASFFSSDIKDRNKAGLIRLPFIFGGPDLSLRRLNLVLNMAEVEEKINVVTRPSILTSNNKIAKILIGQSLPLQTTIEDLTASATRNISTVNYKDTGIILEVKPVINPDRKSVYLDILVEDSVVESGSTKTNEQGIMTNPPVISVIKTKNEVVLKNGQTTIIGGLSSKKTGSIHRSVPFLSKIPVIGEIFKSVIDSNIEKERYIFITPKIIEYEA